MVTEVGGGLPAAVHVPVMLGCTAILVAAQFSGPGSQARRNMAFWRSFAYALTAVYYGVRVVMMPVTSHLSEEALPLTLAVDLFSGGALAKLSGAALQWRGHDGAEAGMRALVGFTFVLVSLCGALPEELHFAVVFVVDAIMNLVVWAVGVTSYYAFVSASKDPAVRGWARVLLVMAFVLGLGQWTTSLEIQGLAHGPVLEGLGWILLCSKLGLVTSFLSAGYAMNPRPMVHIDDESEAPTVTEKLVFMALHLRKP
jgi:hypothetical protein